MPRFIVQNKPLAISLAVVFRLGPQDAQALHFVPQIPSLLAKSSSLNTVPVLIFPANCTFYYTTIAGLRARAAAKINEACLKSRPAAPTRSIERPRPFNLYSPPPPRRKSQAFRRLFFEFFLPTIFSPSSFSRFETSTAASPGN